MLYPEITLSQAADQLLRHRRENALRQFSKGTNKYQDLWRRERRERSKERIRAARLMKTDPLTGLVNKRGFDAHLNDLFRIAQRLNSDGDKKWTIVLATYDVDNFKAFNTHLGHDGGDEALKRFTKALAMPLHRANDMAARPGGDEFWTAYLCEEHTSQSVASRISELSRATIEEDCALFIGNENVLAGTASIGVSFITPQAEDDLDTVISAAIKQADSAAYASKDMGRNRVHLALENGQLIPSARNPVPTPERLIIEEFTPQETPTPQKPAPSVANHAGASRTNRL